MYVRTMHMHPHTHTHTYTCTCMHTRTHTHTHTHTQLQWIVFRTLLPMLVLVLGHLMTSQCDPSQENLERKLALQCRICIYMFILRTVTKDGLSLRYELANITCMLYIYLSMHVHVSTYSVREEGTICWKSLSDGQYYQLQGSGCPVWNMQHKCRAP